MRAHSKKTCHPPRLQSSKLRLSRNLISSGDIPLPPRPPLELLSSSASPNVQSYAPRPSCKHQDFAAISERSCIAMIVDSVVAQSVSLPSFTAKTSAAQIFSVFPDRTTCARAIKISPAAGATRLILYSTVSTDDVAGISPYAAYPHALSAIAAVTPA